MKMKIPLLLLSLLLVTACASKSKQEAVAEKASLYFGQGTAQLEQKNYTEALDYLLQAEQLSPKDSKIHNNLAMAYYFKNQLALAKKHLNISLELDPANSDARINVASIYLEQGQLNLAEKEYSQVLADLVYRQQYRTYYNLALIAIRKNEKYKAITLLQKSINEKKDYCPAHYMIGELIEENSDYTKALKHYREASMGTCYNSPEPHLKQAQMFIKLEQFSAARSKLQEIIEKFPESVQFELANRELDKLSRFEQRAKLNKSVPSSESIEQRNFVTPLF